MDATRQRDMASVERRDRGNSNVVVGRMALLGMTEPRQAVLEEIVGGPALHALDGDVLADSARDDDEGDLQLQFVDDAQGTGGVEAGDGDRARRG